VLPSLRAQEAGAVRSSGPPFSISAIVQGYWPPHAHGIGVEIAGNASYWLSRGVSLGLALRPWAGVLYNPSCGLFDDACLADEQTYAFGTLATVAAYPLMNRLFFLRMGLGVTNLSEQRLGTRPGLVPGAIGILEHRSWRPTMLLGTGLDLSLGPWLFLSPTLELIRTSVGPDPLRTTWPWLVTFSVGLTVG
jgi:hypothetical protein